MYKRQFETRGKWLHEGYDMTVWRQWWFCFLCNRKITLLFLKIFCIDYWINNIIELQNWIFYYYRNITGGPFSPNNFFHSTHNLSFHISNSYFPMFSHKAPKSESTSHLLKLLTHRSQQKRLSVRRGIYDEWPTYEKPSLLNYSAGYLKYLAMSEKGKQDEK